MLPAALVDRDYWCPEIPAQLTIQERCYRVPEVLYAAYRKWRTPEGLERGRREAAVTAMSGRQERAEQLHARWGLEARSLCCEGLPTAIEMYHAVLARSRGSPTFQLQSPAKPLTEVVISAPLANQASQHLLPLPFAG